MRTTLTNGQTAAASAELDKALALLCGTAAPAVLRMLDSSNLQPQVAGRLRTTLDGIRASAAPIELNALDQAFRDLSVLYLSCFSYRPAPFATAGAPLSERIERTDRGGALAVALAQECVARLACSWHGEAGARAIQAGVERQRMQQQQIFRMVESSANQPAGLVRKSG